MSNPERVISKKCLIGTILIGICFSFQICAVTPGHIFIHQRTKILLNILLHPCTAQFFSGLIGKLLKSRPSVTICKSRTRNIYHTHRRPVGLNIVQIAVILHSPCKKNHLFTDTVVKFLPAILVFILFLNRHQRSCHGVGTAANLNVKRSVILCKNPFLHQFRTFCLLRSITYVFNISHFCDGTKIIRGRIVLIMYLQIVINLCIRIQKFIHPVSSHPSKGFCSIIPTVMQFGTGLYDSLQINVVRIKQRMN